MQFQCWIGHCIWNSVLTELRANCTQNDALWLSPFTINPPIIRLSPVCTKARVLRLRHIGGCGSYQVVTDDIEVDPFGRCRGDIGKLIAANECILHIRMGLRAASLNQSPKSPAGF